jgi:DNA-binding XRE family transcriptional regulator
MTAGGGLQDIRPLPAFFMARGDIGRKENHNMSSLSPFQTVRENLGASKKAIALATGVNYFTIMQTERGLIKRPLTYARALEEAGFIEDAEAILKEHAEWLQKLQRENLQTLQARA